MIKEERVKIRPTTKEQAEYYSKQLGYQISVHDTIEIFPNQLMPQSHCLITAICDHCAQEKLMEYRTYRRITQAETKPYHCRVCAVTDIKQIIMAKYGVDNPFASSIVQEKIKETNLLRYGVPYPSQRPEHRDSMKGDKNRFWIDGRASEIARRNNSRLKSWRREVYLRDGYRCAICGQGVEDGVKIEAHHLENYADNQDKIYDVNNGITLCKSHHRLLHNLKGYHVSKEDYLSFVEGQTTISQESTGEDELPSEVHRNPLG